MRKGLTRRAVRSDSRRTGADRLWRKQFGRASSAVEIWYEPLIERFEGVRCTKSAIAVLTQRCRDHHRHGGSIRAPRKRCIFFPFSRPQCVHITPHTTRFGATKAHPMRTGAGHRGPELQVRSGTVGPASGCRVTVEEGARSIIGNRKKAGSCDSCKTTI